jgi:hypothetical protein
MTTTKNFGEKVTFTATASGGTSPYTYSWAGLPAPLVSANTNVISGIPSAPGTYNVTVTVSDTAGNHASATGTLIVLPPVLSVILTIN